MWRASLGCHLCWKSTLIGHSSTIIWSLECSSSQWVQVTLDWSKRWVQYWTLVYRWGSGSKLQLLELMFNLFFQFFENLIIDFLLLNNGLYSLEGQASLIEGFGRPLASWCRWYLVQLSEWLGWWWALLFLVVWLHNLVSNRHLRITITDRR